MCQQFKLEKKSSIKMFSYSDLTKCLLCHKTKMRKEEDPRTTLTFENKNVNRFQVTRNFFPKDFHCFGFSFCSTKFEFRTDKVNSNLLIALHYMYIIFFPRKWSNGCWLEKLNFQTDETPRILIIYFLKKVHLRLFSSRRQSNRSWSFLSVIFWYGQCGWIGCR